MTADPKEGRLARWSRLKQEDAAKVTTPSVETVPDVPAEDADVPEIRAEDLPDIDTLDEHSDFTPFLQKGVPEELSRLALRKLWKTNPVFANLDGLNEYDDDYSIIETLKAATDTAYKIGRGFMTDEDLAEADVTDAEDMDEDDAPAVEDEPAALTSETQASEGVATPDMGNSESADETDPIPTKG